MSKYILLFLINNINPIPQQKKIPKFYKVQIPFKNSLKFFENLNKPYLEKGLCSYYHNIFNGNKTSTGDIFSNNKWTCAHKTLPLPAVILVMFYYNNQIRAVKLLVNDRGPFIKNRIIDVSEKVAKEIGIRKKGLKKIIIILLKNETIKLLKTGLFFPIEKLLTIKEINKILKENNL